MAALTPLIQAPARPAPKQWHCGHGVKAHWKKALDDGTALIAWERAGVGRSTKQQFQKFQLEATAGDIIYMHSSTAKGGSRLTHWGRYNGTIKTDYAPDDGEVSKDFKWDNERSWQGWMHTSISVDEWVELPRGLAGQGLNQTLYEVSDPNTENYRNYSVARA